VWVPQCHGVNTGLTAKCRTVVGMASLEGLVEQRRDMIPKLIRGAVWRGFVFHLGACMCQNIKCFGRGSRWGAASPWEPRVRRSLARGGIQPSSEAESRPRGRPALERGRVLLVWCCIPRAKGSFAQGGAEADCYGGSLGPPGPWSPTAGLWSSRACFMAVGSFVFLYLRKKMEFPPVF
jgi:hypothetical protein